MNFDSLAIAQLLRRIGERNATVELLDCLLVIQRGLLFGIDQHFTLYGVRCGSRFGEDVANRVTVLLGQQAQFTLASFGASELDRTALCRTGSFRWGRVCERRRRRGRAGRYRCVQSVVGEKTHRNVGQGQALGLQGVHLHDVKLSMVEATRYGRGGTDCTHEAMQDWPALVSKRGVNAVVD